MDKPFSPNESFVHGPCGSYFDMPYFYPPWFPHCSYMLSPPMYYGPNSFSYREPASSRSPHLSYDRLDQQNRSSRENKPKVVKQVCRAKENCGLNENSDLARDNEMPTNSEVSANSSCVDVPNDKHVSNIKAEQVPSLGPRHNPKTKGKKKPSYSKLMAKWCPSGLSHTQKRMLHRLRQQELKDQQAEVMEPMKEVCATKQEWRPKKIVSASL
ncbi:hypothetical protein BS78_08G093100 [Paspalum vaginatum]|nr:hypothetical protein BS78_08G093100 [Paspalum vaginatum]